MNVSTKAYWSRSWRTEAACPKAPLITLSKRTPPPIAENAGKIARALDVSVEYLVTEKDRAPGHIPAHVPKIHHITDTLRCMNDSQLDFVGEVIRLIEKNVR